MRWYYSQAASKSYDGGHPSKTSVASSEGEDYGPWEAINPVLDEQSQAALGYASEFYKYGGSFDCHHHLTSEDDPQVKFTKYDLTLERWSEDKLHGRDMIKVPRTHGELLQPGVDLTYMSRDMWSQ